MLRSLDGTMCVRLCQLFGGCGYRIPSKGYTFYYASWLIFFHSSAVYFALTVWDLLVPGQLILQIFSNFFFIIFPYISASLSDYFSFTVSNTDFTVMKNGFFTFLYFHGKRLGWSQLHLIFFAFLVGNSIFHIVRSTATSENVIFKSL
jgi:hypothetical protein